MGQGLDKGLIRKALQPPNGHGWVDVIKASIPAITMIVAATVWLMQTMETQESAKSRAAQLTEAADKRMADILDKVKLQREVQLQPLAIQITQNVKDITEIKDDVGKMETDLRTILDRVGDRRINP